MVKKLNSLVVLFLIVFVFECCNKENNCSSGLDGEATIVSFAKHGNQTLINYSTHPDTVFVKFASTTYPTDNLWDTVFISEAGEDHIHCENLSCGKYYFYRTAWDSLTNQTYYAGRGIDIGELTGELDLIFEVQ